MRTRRVFDQTVTYFILDIATAATVLNFILLEFAPIMPVFCSLPSFLLKIIPANLVHPLCTLHSRRNHTNNYMFAHAIHGSLNALVKVKFKLRRQICTVSIYGILLLVS